MSDTNRNSDPSGVAGANSGTAPDPVREGWDLPSPPKPVPLKAPAPPRREYVVLAFLRIVWFVVGGIGFAADVALAIGALRSRTDEEWRWFASYALWFFFVGLAAVTIGFALSAVRDMALRSQR